MAARVPGALADVLPGAPLPAGHGPRPLPLLPESTAQAGKHTPDAPSLLPPTPAPPSFHLKEAFS